MQPPFSLLLVRLPVKAVLHSSLGSAFVLTAVSTSQLGESRAICIIDDILLGLLINNDDLLEFLPPCTRKADDANDRLDVN